jgi:hypothetical protein
MRVPWSFKYLLLRHHVAHAPGSSAGSPFLSSAEAIAATISAFDFPFSTSFGLRQEDARKRFCGLRIKANGERILGFQNSGASVVAAPNSGSMVTRLP